MEMTVWHRPENRNDAFAHALAQHAKVALWFPRPPHALPTPSFKDTHAQQAIRPPFSQACLVIRRICCTKPKPVLVRKRLPLCGPVPLPGRNVNFDMESNGEMRVIKLAEVLKPQTVLDVGANVGQ
jgi:hypothetical protein